MTRPNRFDLMVLIMAEPCKNGAFRSSMPLNIYLREICRDCTQSRCFAEEVHGSDSPRRLYID